MVIVEIEKKVQEIREITGKPPGVEWLVSTLLKIMDKDTKTNVSSTMAMDITSPTPRGKGRAYATLMGGSPSHKGPWTYIKYEKRKRRKLARK